MKITADARMPANATQALGQEVKQLKEARKSSAFKLDVTRDPTGFKVSVNEIKRMLEAASVSKDYKAHAEKYQFKVVTSRSGNKTLTLKEQGFFSKLQGHFGIRREKREQQRAEAAKLIGDAFSRAELEARTAVQVDDEQMTHNDAISFKDDLMQLSDLSPKTAGRSRVAKGADNAAEPSSMASGDWTFEKLLDEGANKELDAPGERSDTSLRMSNESENIGLMDRLNDNDHYGDFTPPPLLGKMHH